MKTFMLYLNNEFQDGSTNFVDEKQQLFKVTLNFRYRLIISKWTNWQQSNIRGGDLHKMLIICYQIPCCCIYFASSKIFIESFGKDLTMGALNGKRYSNPSRTPGLKFRFFVFLFDILTFCINLPLWLYLVISVSFVSSKVHSDTWCVRHRQNKKKKNLSNSLIQYYEEIFI
jgi:hypothetical protein